MKAKAKLLSFCMHACIHKHLSFSLLSLELKKVRIQLQRLSLRCIAFLSFQNFFFSIPLVSYRQDWIQKSFQSQNSNSYSGRISISLISISAAVGRCIQMIPKIHEYIFHTLYEFNCFAFHEFFLFTHVKSQGKA